VSASIVHPGADLEGLPPIPPAAVPWLIGALLATWLALRVWILRGRIAARDADEAPPRALAPLRGLARNPLALPALVLLALALGAGAWLAWR
jgi:hypothetical protein